jgi:N-acetylmuramoyl-L-alanine amidase
MRDRVPGRFSVSIAGSIVVLLSAACTSGGASRIITTGNSSPASSTAASSTAAKSTAASSTASRSPAPSHTAAALGPVIVIDPGHSVPIHATDPVSGLDVSDYENDPEMRDVFAVAELVRDQLQHAGYRVVMTKNSLDAPTSLAQRAAVANAAHAALALSIHDQAGGSGGIGFTVGNNTVYYQSVGGYRETSSGTKVVFSDASVAALSKKYAAVFQRQRAMAQGVPISVLGNTGYDLATRGLPAGDIWIVQLLSHVPWIYNEAGGNSTGRIGLSAADEQRYAAGLVAAVEACVPITR